MTGKSLKEEVLNKIKKEKIEPKSKFDLAVRDYLIWLTLVLFFIIGSLATSVIIFMIDNGVWDLYDQLGASLIGFIFATLPYFWLAILIFFVLILYYVFKYTKGGYRYHAYSVVISTILLSVVFGFIFYNVGLAQIIEGSLNHNLPLYNRFLNNKQRVLTQPKIGVLSGNLVELITDDSFKLADMNGNIWVIISKDKIDRLDLLKPGMGLILLGQQVDEAVFEAEEIRPLMRTEIRFFQRRIMPMRLNLEIERKYL